MKFSIQLGKFSFALGAGPVPSNPPPATRTFQLSSFNAQPSTPATLLSPYEQSVWVYTAASALAQTVSSIPFRISEGDRSGENLLSKGPVVDLFDHPHPYLNRFRFWELIVTWYCLRGETFIVALDKNDAVLPIQRFNVSTLQRSDASA